jgi:hypothetical protein
MADESTSIVEEQHHPSVLARRVAPTVYSYHYYRIFLCGHPSELVEVSRKQLQREVVQTVVAKDEKDCCHTRLTYTRDRCLHCAASLRDQHQILPLQEDSKEAQLTPMAAYPVEATRLDRGLLKEAKSGFEKKLRQLSQVDFLELSHDTAI